MPSQALECKNICFSYSKEHLLFANVSFSLVLPGFFSMFGRSGVGKSTLARIIADPNFNLAGGVIQRPPNVLYCYSGERLPGWQSVHGHLLEVTPPQSVELIDEFSERLNLSSDLLLRRPNSLSSGQHSRANLLRYLLQDFDLLILDETLSNVDEPTRFSILAFMKERFGHRSFLYISHNITEVFAFASSVILLKKDASGVSVREVPGRNLVRFTPEQDYGWEAITGDALRYA